MNADDGQSASEGDLSTQSYGAESRIIAGRDGNARSSIDHWLRRSERSNSFAGAPIRDSTCCGRPSQGKSLQVNSSIEDDLIFEQGGGIGCRMPAKRLL
jgi:hypothetical protein